MQQTTPTTRQRIIADCLESPIGFAYLESERISDKNIKTYESQEGYVMSHDCVESLVDACKKEDEFNGLLDVVLPEPDYCYKSESPSVFVCLQCQQPCQ